MKLFLTPVLALCLGLGATTMVACKSTSAEMQAADSVTMDVTGMT